MTRLFFYVGVLMTFLFLGFQTKQEYPVTYLEVNPKEVDLKFFHKDSSGNVYGKIGRLKEELESRGKNLRFAMNGGMYKEDMSPLGLFIENGEKISEINRREEGYGNFFLQPNGVFYINNDGSASITVSSNFEENEDIDFATQSGPMLIVDGNIHEAFNKGSKNLHIRNGVGVREDGTLIFAISDKRINFYDFASFFKEQDCANALYLDGFVSRMYCPEIEKYQEGGNYSIIIGITE